MTKRTKIISFTLLAFFTLLIAGEMAGFRVHHAESTELIHVNQGVPLPARDSSNDPTIPCKNDETPIEHVIHYSAGYVPVGNAFVSFPMSFILAIWNPAPLVPLVIKTSYALKDQIFKSLLAFDSSSYRAPPVIL